MLSPEEKTTRLSDPIATCGDRVYVICSQNGLFPDSWGGHVPGEMGGVWNHPIKLLDGFWFGIAEAAEGSPHWLQEALACRAHPGYTEFDYAIGPLRITRRDVVPDGVEGLVVTLSLRSIDAALFGSTLQITTAVRSDLRPAWLGQEAGMRDAPDSVSITAAGELLFRDSANPWACAVATDQPAVDSTTGREVWGPQRTGGIGTGAQLTCTVTLDALGRASLSLFIAGSAESERAALRTLAALRADAPGFFAAKRKAMDTVVRTSRLITPDARLNAAAAWSKVITQMLMRSVPEHGSGIGAGLPEYPWWFGIDSAYAILPMLQSGQFELVKDTLRLLKAQSERANPNELGRVIHEMSTTGAVFNAGNAVETPAFVRAVHQTWQWTGDRAFLDEMYAFCKAGMLDYLLGTQDPDGDRCPSGRSIIETLEMHMGIEALDTAAYTCEALVQLAALARVVGDAIAPELEAKSAALAARIRDEWWLEDAGLFADARGSIDEMRDKLGQLERAANEQLWQADQRRQMQTAHALFAPEFARHAGQPTDIDLHWLLRHWVVLCPLESGIATAQQAARTLQRLSSTEFSNEWGLYLHPNRHDVMSINTGLLALSAARYGHTDTALDTINKLTRAFGYRTPGAVCEALPDQWCFVQTWSNVGLVAPAVECFLGIEADAPARTLRVIPQLPENWDHAGIDALRVGDASITAEVARTADGLLVRVSSPDDWRYELGAVLPAGVTTAHATFNGAPVALRIVPTRRGLCAWVAVAEEGELRLTI